VALRVALKARAKAAFRQSRQRELIDMPRTDPLDDHTWQELRPILDEEIGRLPEKCRAPLVLCYFEGKSYDQAAQELGWPKSSLASRLARGRDLLRQRLVKRGITLSAAAATTGLTERVAQAGVAALLTINTVKAAASIAAGTPIAQGVLSAEALALAEEAMKPVFGIKGKLVLLLGVLGLAVGAAFAGYGAWVGEAPPREEEKPPPVAQDQPPKKGGPGPAVDRHGDPLPEGAVARLGTLRFRHGANTAALAYSPDGKWLASLAGGGGAHTLYLLEAATGKVVHRAPLGPDRSFLRASAGDSALAFSTDSKTLVTPRGAIDVATGKVLHSLLGKGKLSAGGAREWKAACSPDGKLVACHQQAGKEGTGIILIDATTGTELRRLGWDDKDNRRIPLLPCPVFSSDGALLATASADLKVIRLWEVGTGKELRRLSGHTQAVRGLAFSPDGKLLASTGDKELIRLWDVTTGKELDGIKRDVYACAIRFAPDGKLLAIDVRSEKILPTAKSDTVRLYDPGSGKELCRWQMPCACVAFTPDGKVLASAGMGGDRVVHRWDLIAGKSLDDADRNHLGQAHALQFAPDGKSLSSLDVRATVVEWDLATKRSRNTTFAGSLEPRLYRLRKQGVKLSPTGKVVAIHFSGATRKKESLGYAVHLYDAVSGKLRHVIPATEHSGHAEFSPDGKTLARPSPKGVELWDVTTGKQLPHRPLPGGHFLVWTGDGRRLAIISNFEKPQLHLCDVATGKELRRLALNGNKSPGPRAIAVSPDGRSLAWFGQKELVVIDTESRKERVFPTKATGSPEGRAQFSPSGEYLAVAPTDTIQLWEVRSGQLSREFRAGQRVTAIRFSADGRALASGGEDGTLLLWGLYKVQRPAGPAKTLRPADLEKCWQALADGDAKQAFDALCDLVAAPRDAVPFLEDRIKPAAPLDMKRVGQLISQLDDPEFKVRDQASKELLHLDKRLVPVLDKALAARPPAERKRRLEDLRGKLTGVVLHGQGLRAARAVEVLELIGTPEARRALRALADGAPGALLTTNAQAALKR
jgi:WD40 repeat protein